jgi:hypothetical protein
MPSVTVYTAAQIDSMLAGLGTGGGLNTEQIQDLVSALLQDNASIDWQYNDQTGVLVAVIKPLAITAGMLSTAVQSDISAKALDAEATKRVVYNGVAWVVLPGGRPVNEVFGPKEWLRMDGDPDPTSLMAENDTTIGYYDV